MNENPKTSNIKKQREYNIIYKKKLKAKNECIQKYLLFNDIYCS